MSHLEKLCQIGCLQNPLPVRRTSHIEFIDLGKSKLTVQVAVSKRGSVLLLDFINYDLLKALKSLGLASATENFLPTADISSHGADDGICRTGLFLPSAYGLGERYIGVELANAHLHASDNVRPASLIDGATSSRKAVSKHLNAGVDVYATLGEVSNWIFRLHATFGAHQLECDSRFELENIISCLEACLHRLHGRILMVRSLIYYFFTTLPKPQFQYWAVHHPIYCNRLPFPIRHAWCGSSHPMLLQ